MLPYRLVPLAARQPRGAPAAAAFRCWCLKPAGRSPALGPSSLVEGSEALGSPSCPGRSSWIRLPWALLPPNPFRPEVTLQRRSAGSREALPVLLLAALQCSARGRGTSGLAFLYSKTCLAPDSPAAA